MWPGVDRQEGGLAVSVRGGWGWGLKSTELARLLGLHQQVKIPFTGGCEAMQTEHYSIDCRQFRSSAVAVM